jgi:hypothetical protein
MAKAKETIYLCVLDGSYEVVREGKTLEEAFDEVKGYDDDARFENCTFYRAEKLKVEGRMVIMEKQELVEVKR